MNTKQKMILWFSIVMFVVSIISLCIYFEINIVQDTSKINLDMPDWLIWLGIFIKYLFILISAIITGISLFLLVTPLYKDDLLHDPDHRELTKMFIVVGTKENVVIDFGGRPAYHLNDSMDKPHQSEYFLFGLNKLWNLYKRYIFWSTGYHVYLPFFTEPKTYDLRRYVEREFYDNNGKSKLSLHQLTEKEEGFHSNHVKTGPFTWFFHYTGVDIQRVPFTIEGSLQMKINSDPEKIERALYHTMSWNMLLDQALNSVVVSTVRNNVSIDMVLGAISEILWDQTMPPEELHEKVSNLIFKKLKNYQFDPTIGDDYANKHLDYFGIDIFKVDITDFQDELSESEREKFRAAVFGREAGRAKHLEEQGLAKGQEELLKVLSNEDFKGMSEIALKNRSFVDAVKNGGTLDTLLAALIKKNLD